MKSILLFLILFSSLLFSQPQWINYTNSNTAVDITADGDFLWLCTTGGLVKFNKRTGELVFFNKGNSLIPSNRVLAADIDPQGYIWAATDNGLVKMKDGELHVFNSSNSLLPENYITSVATDNEGVIWIGTFNSGLIRYNGTSWTIYNSSNSPLPHNYITSLLFKNGFLWICTYGGALKKDNTGFTLLQPTINSHPSSIDIDLAGNIWTAGSSIIKMTSAGILSDILPFRGQFVHVDERNVKWFGLINDPPMPCGMFRIDSAGTSLYSVPDFNNLLEYDLFYSMYSEPGIKYAGTASGLIKFETEGTIYKTSNADLLINEASGIMIDKLGRKWIYNWGDIPLGGVYLPPGYVSLFSSNSWHLFSSANSPVTHAGVTKMADGEGNSVYAALEWNGVYTFDGTTWTSLQGPVTSEVTELFYDATITEPVLLAGAGSYLYKYANGTWSALSNFPLCNVKNIKRKGDELWLATDIGVIKYNYVNYTIYNSSNSGLPWNDCYSLDLDLSGNIWIGTAMGLAKFTGTNWTVYNRYNSPLSDDLIPAVAVDSNYIYILNTQGLVKFDGTSWNIFSKYNSGLADNPWQVNPYSPGSGIEAEGAKIWIASKGGVSVYDRFGIPLPVELISFTASAEGNYVRLSWMTATETNNRGFDVERKYPGEEWKQIMFIKGSGTSTEPKSYTYIDDNPGIGKVKYRLRQTDFNGDYTYSSEAVAEISLPGEYYLFQNYPNPFNPSTRIRFIMAKSGRAEISLTDILGNQKMLLNEVMDAGEHEYHFNAGSMAAGVYIYTLKTGDFTQSRKLILIK
jgi:hypothetical protein